MIVDQHQPVVEKYYGAGKMKSVIIRLLEECDRVTKSLLESWEEERSMKRKASKAHIPGAGYYLLFYSWQTFTTTLPFPCFLRVVDANSCLRAQKCLRLTHERLIKLYPK
jgi:hypothetical protein